MRLRTRLWLVLGALFLVPLVVGGLVLLVVVPDARSARVTDTVRTARAAVAAEVSDTCRLLGAASPACRPRGRDATRSPSTWPSTAATATTRLSLEPDGTVRAEAGRLGGGIAAAVDLPRCSGETTGGAALAEQAGGEDGGPTAVVVTALDADFLDQLRRRAGPGRGGGAPRRQPRRRQHDGCGDGPHGRGGSGRRRPASWTWPAGPSTSSRRSPACRTPSLSPSRTPGVAPRHCCSPSSSWRACAVAGALVTVVARGLSQPFSRADRGRRAGCAGRPGHRHHGRPPARARPAGSAARSTR